MSDWVALANDFAGRQFALLQEAAGEVLANASLAAHAPVVGAGCGRFLARRLATRLGRRYLDFSEVINADPGAREMAARCAPAVAVAILQGTSQSGRPGLSSPFSPNPLHWDQNDSRRSQIDPRHRFQRRS